MLTNIDQVLLLTNKKTNTFGSCQGFSQMSTFKESVLSPFPLHLINRKRQVCFFSKATFPNRKSKAQETIMENGAEQNATAIHAV